MRLPPEPYYINDRRIKLTLADDLAYNQFFNLFHGNNFSSEIAVIRWIKYLDYNEIMLMPGKKIIFADLILVESFEHEGSTFYKKMFGVTMYWSDFIQVLKELSRVSLNWKKEGF